MELCAKGWNWGEASFRGSLMSFLVDNKPAFEIPLAEVSQVGGVWLLHVVSDGQVGVVNPRRLGLQ